MPLDVPADTTLSGEEFFRTEGAYTSLGAPIPGGQVGRWILREGPHIDSDVEMFDELCWRLVGDGLPLFRATLHMGTLHPQIRGVGVVKAIGNILVIIDEGDRAFGSSGDGGEGDGGTSSRVIARIKEFMSDTANRGRVKCPTVNYSSDPGI